MEGKTDNGGSCSQTTDASRRAFLKLGGTLTGFALLSSMGLNRAFAAGHGKTLAIGSTGHAENVAVAWLSKVVLEQELGYDHVRIATHKAHALFHRVANGSLDIFQDVWLPRTSHGYWRRYGRHIERLDSWYSGYASLGLVVPDYVNIHSLRQLGAFRKKFGGRVLGLRHGTSERQIIRNNFFQNYHLWKYKYTASSLQAILEELGHAIERRKPIVATLYKPHWAFSVYPIRYLEDPLGTVTTQNERLYSVVRRGLERDKPDAYAFLNAISLNRQQLISLELAIRAARTPENGVKKWLASPAPFGSSHTDSNQQVVQPWIQAARKAQSAR